MREQAEGIGAMAARMAEPRTALVTASEGLANRAAVDAATRRVRFADIEFRLAVLICMSDANLAPLLKVFQR